jgi:hypothetical protein
MPRLSAVTEIESASKELPLWKRRKGFPSGCRNTRTNKLRPKPKRPVQGQSCLAPRTRLD